jgi:trehalose 6-phosphate synthase/phosphatase
MEHEKDWSRWHGIQKTPAMNTLRGRRVIIASLFLPNTAVLGDSVPTSPERRDDISIPTAVKSKPASRIGSALPSGSNLSGPLKSIVEDLKDKVIFILPVDQQQY